MKIIIIFLLCCSFAEVAAALLLKRKVTFISSLVAHPSYIRMAYITTIHKEKNVKKLGCFSHIYELLLLFIGRKSHQRGISFLLGIFSFFSLFVFRVTSSRRLLKGYFHRVNITFSAHKMYFYIIRHVLKLSFYFVKKKKKDE